MPLQEAGGCQGSGGKPQPWGAQQQQSGAWQTLAGDKPQGAGKEVGEEQLELPQGPGKGQGEGRGLPRGSEGWQQEEIQGWQEGPGGTRWRQQEQQPQQLALGRGGLALETLGLQIPPGTAELELGEQ